jgi:hypothetical protein
MIFRKVIISFDSRSLKFVSDSARDRPRLNRIEGIVSVRTIYTVYRVAPDPVGYVRHSNVGAQTRMTQYIVPTGDRAEKGE